MLFVVVSGPYIRLRLSLEILREAGLYLWMTGNSLCISILPANGKADLTGLL